MSNLFTFFFLELSTQWLLTAYLVLHQPITIWAFLAARPRPIVEIVLFTLVTAISHKAFSAFTATIIFALEGKGPLRMTVTSCRIGRKECMSKEGRVYFLLTQTDNNKLTTDIIGLF
jgi:hypothetical protein